MTPTLLTLTPVELRERQTSGELWCVLDVREPWEIEIASVSGALRVPMNQVPARLAELREAESIAVLCHTGVRSALIGNWLLQNGISTVANIAGGIDAWATDVDASIPRY